MMFLLLFLCLRAVGGQHHPALQKLKRSMPLLRVEAIVDIGANNGKWAQAVRRTFPSSKILMLDGSEMQAGLLERAAREMGDAESRIAVLERVAGKRVPWYGLDKYHTGNSMFRETSGFFAGAAPTERVTSTVDAEVARSFLRDAESIDVLKIDVQGAELVVLEGATETLARTLFVHLESSVVDYNAGGACYFDVDAYLRSRGFFLHDFGDMMFNRRLFKTPGVGQFDALYINPHHPKAPPRMRANAALYCGQRAPRRRLTAATPHGDAPAAAPRRGALARALGYYLAGVVTCLAAVRLGRPGKAR